MVRKILPSFSDKRKAYAAAMFDPKRSLQVLFFNRYVVIEFSLAYWPTFSNKPSGCLYRE